jgi:prevent-host-death family protein
MKFITVSDLSHKATLIVSEMESTGEEVVITKKGKPLVLMSLVSNCDFALKERKGVKKHGKRNLQKR